MLFALMVTGTGGCCSTLGLRVIVGMIVAGLGLVKAGCFSMPFEDLNSTLLPGLGDLIPSLC